MKISAGDGRREGGSEDDTEEGAEQEGIINADTQSNVAGNLHNWVDIMEERKT